MVVKRGRGRRFNVVDLEYLKFIGASAYYKTLRQTRSKDINLYFTSISNRQAYINCNVHTQCHPIVINITQARSSTRLKMKRNVMISLEKNAKHIPVSCLKVLSFMYARVA